MSRLRRGLEEPRSLDQLPRRSSIFQAFPGKLRSANGGRVNATLAYAAVSQPRLQLKHTLVQSIHLQLLLSYEEKKNRG